jgi:hypothetical protein
MQGTLLPMLLVLLSKALDGCSRRKCTHCTWFKSTKAERKFPFYFTLSASCGLSQRCGPRLDTRPLWAVNVLALACSARYLLRYVSCARFCALCQLRAVSCPQLRHSAFRCCVDFASKRRQACQEQTEVRKEKARKDSKKTAKCSISRVPERLE